MYVSAALTLLSGIDYIARNFDASAICNGFEIKV